MRAPCYWDDALRLDQLHIARLERVAVSPEEAAIAVDEAVATFFGRYATSPCAFSP